MSAPPQDTAAAAPAGDRAVTPLPELGVPRFRALRHRWLTVTREPAPLPAVPMDDDAIIDACTSCPGDVLEPPVHLPIMAGALSIAWEEEGLYN